MKTTGSILLLLALLITASSCNKNTPATSGINTWSWMGVSYTGTRTSFDPNYSQLLVDDSTTHPTSYSGIYLTFLSGVPTTPGTYTYTVTDNAGHSTAVNQITVECDNAIAPNGQTYQGYVSTGANGTQTVSVTLSATGKISAHGSNITLQQRTNLSDSASNCSFNVSQ